MKSRIKGLGAVALAAVALGAMSANAATVALVTINQQALFFNQINDGAKQAADKAGAKLVIFNANNVAAAQNSAIEDYIAQKVDGIVLVAIDVNGVKPAVTAAKNAGIPVVAIDARIPDGDNAAFIGVDNKGAGEEIGKYFADYAKSKMGGSAKVGIVGALNSFIQNQRLDGFKADCRKRQRGEISRHGRWPEHPGRRADRGRKPDDRQSRHERDLRHG